MREVADLCEQALARERTARQFRALFQALRVDVSRAARAMEVDNALDGVERLA